MGSAGKDGPSPILNGLKHAGLGVTTLGAAAAAVAGLVHWQGDVRDAGPVYQVALFDPVDPVTPAPDGLKARLPDPTLKTRPGLAALAVMDPEPFDESDAADYAALAEAARPPLLAASATDVRAGAAATDEADERVAGVRINGRTVLPGESLSEVAALEALEPSPIEGLLESTAFGRLPRIGPDGREPADAYARPFYNRSGAPTVSIVLGGLGINYTHTMTAIEELPPEVTLSFAAHARGLETWIRRARADGHEVLIEMPMEPFDHGRISPHPQTLTAGAPAEENVDNLRRVLALAHGYYGVVNYQGGKFAADNAAVDPVLEELAARGLALVEDGSLGAASFEAAAGRTGVRYARADSVIDARIDADAIDSALQGLEARALEEGSALGTAIAYPVTIDTLKDWTGRLAEKGIRLAPASSLRDAPARRGVPGDAAAAPEMGGPELPALSDARPFGAGNLP